MFYENDESIIIKQNEQLICQKAYQIHNGLLYHYTECETFWKIIDSDSFFARNIRFSNDSNEYMSGRDTIKKFIQQQNTLKQNQKDAILKQIEDNPMMYFIVCFCRKGDLLSQWRGYAQTGVSIGLDFTSGISTMNDIRRHVEYFTVLNNHDYQKNRKEDDNKYFIENNDGNKIAVKFLQMPYKVQYVSTSNINIHKRVLNVLEELWEKSEPEERINNLMKYIPFIKNDGFKEEEEYRLVFDMEYLGKNKAYSRNMRSKKIDYLDSGNIKKPYVNIEFGQPEYKLEKVNSVKFGNDMTDIATQMQTNKIFQDDNINILLDNTKKGVYIGEGKNQEDIMEQIEKYVELFSAGKKKGHSFKIWCKGHLPIREIIIGPGKQQKEMQECLEYYKNTLYWLRYVDVKLSRIPLRN